MAGMPTRLLIALLAGSTLSLGCGSTKSRIATEQLLVSDAVDRAVASIDFRSLAGENVYFDTRYLVNVKGVGFVNSEYIVSSLRQQMVAADLRLKDKPEEADFVVEARVGTLGSDGNEIIYGIPANKGLSEASSVLPNAPALPAIPEISVARKESQLGAVKVAAFAYDRKTGGPIWQSGVARAKTTSQDVWLFGAGPFQRGSIHSGTNFAGGELHLPGRSKPPELLQGPPVAIDQEFYFPRPGQAPPVETQLGEAPPGAAATVAGRPEPEAAAPNAAQPAPTVLQPLPPVANPNVPPRAVPPGSAPPPAGSPTPVPVTR